jgi:hypothetical protein
MFDGVVCSVPAENAQDGAQAVPQAMRTAATMTGVWLAVKAEVRPTW